MLGSWLGSTTYLPWPEQQQTITRSDRHKITLTVGINNDEGDGIESVTSLNVTLLVLHLFAVAVIGGDHNNTVTGGDLI